MKVVIRRIHIRGFKSLADVQMELGPLNLLIGANASGKSNFFDALRVLQGVGYGLTISQILDGKPAMGPSPAWPGIRGGSRSAGYRRTDHAPPARSDFELQWLDQASEIVSATYRVAFDAAEARVRGEELEVKSRTTHPLEVKSETIFSIEGWAATNRLPVRWQADSEDLPEWDRPILGRYPTWQHSRRDAFLKVEGFAYSLQNAQFLDLRPEILRRYGLPSSVARMGDQGENFASVVREALSSSRTRSAILAWMKELTPSEIGEVKTIQGALDEPLFAVTEGKNGEATTSAAILSDGTLRFAALVAAFFQPTMPSVLAIEEIENGIHASRLRVLVDLLRNQTEAGKTQVVATTHSPLVLQWLRGDELKYVFLFRRDEKTGESQILPLASKPEVLEALHKYSASDLMTESWLEEVL